MKIISEKTLISLIVFIFGILIGSDIGNFKEYVKKYRLEETRKYWDSLEYKLIPNLNMRIYGDRFGGSIMEAMINADILFRKENGLNDLTAVPEFECKDKEKEEYVTKIGKCYARAYKEELISDLNKKKESYTSLEKIQKLLDELYNFKMSIYSHDYAFWILMCWFFYPKKDEEIGEEQPSELTNNKKENL